MKRKTLFVGAGMALLLSLNGVAVGALPVSKSVEIKRALADVAAPEIAARAASLVAEAPILQREEISLEVVRLIAAKKVSVLPAVVGAISKISPENSATIAGEAASLSPEQAESIAAAAASVAPAEAGKIAAHVAKATPKNAVMIARTVAALAPEEIGDIQENVAVSVPSSRADLQADETLIRYSRASATAQVGLQGSISSHRGTIRGRILPLIAQLRIASGRIALGSFDGARNYAIP